VIHEPVSRLRPGSYTAAARLVMTSGSRTGQASTAWTMASRQVAVVRRSKARRVLDRRTQRSASGVEIDQGSARSNASALGMNSRNDHSRMTKWLARARSRGRSTSATCQARTIATTRDTSKVTWMGIPEPFAIHPSLTRLDQSRVAGPSRIDNADLIEAPSEAHRGQDRGDRGRQGQRQHDILFVGKYLVWRDYL
jgi:hypothetical protein